MVGITSRRTAGIGVILMLVGALAMTMALPALAAVSGPLVDNFPPGPGQDTCPDSGGWQRDGDDVGSFSGEWGSAVADGTSVEVNLNEGYEAIVCVKTGAPASGQGREFYLVTHEDSVQTVTHTGGELSHWAILIEKLEAPPTSEDTTPTTEETTPTTEDTTPTTEDTTPTTGETTATTEDDTEVGGIVVTNPSNPQVTPTTAASTSASTLPFTGVSTGSVAAIAAALVAMGTLLLAASRRSEDKVAGRTWS